MYVVSNVCRHVIYQETFSEVSLCVHRCCVGILQFMLKCVALNVLKWSFDVRYDYV